MKTVFILKGLNSAAAKTVAKCIDPNGSKSIYFHWKKHKNNLFVLLQVPNHLFVSNVAKVLLKKMLFEYIRWSIPAKDPSNVMFATRREQILFYFTWGHSVLYYYNVCFFQNLGLKINII